MSQVDAGQKDRPPHLRAGQRMDLRIWGYTKMDSTLIYFVFPGSTADLMHNVDPTLPSTQLLRILVK